MPRTNQDPEVCITKGTPVKNRGFAIQAANGTIWYRHDKVEVDGKTLEGYIQVRKRTYGSRIGKRIETITCFKGSCVLGHDVNWLIRMNNPQTNNDKRTVELLTAAKESNTYA